jgi:hypothetical protein
LLILAALFSIFVMAGNALAKRAKSASVVIPGDTHPADTSGSTIFAYTPAPTRPDALRDIHSVIFQPSQSVTTLDGSIAGESFTDASLRYRNSGILSVTLPLELSDAAATLKDNEIFISIMVELPAETGVLYKDDSVIYTLAANACEAFTSGANEIIVKGNDADYKRAATLGAAVREYNKEVPLGIILNPGFSTDEINSLSPIFEFFVLDIRPLGNDVQLIDETLKNSSVYFSRHKMRVIYGEENLPAEGESPLSALFNDNGVTGLHSMIPPAYVVSSEELVVSS